MDTQHELSASLARYLTYLAGRNVSEHTRVAYSTDLSQFFSYLTENDITVTNRGTITATHITDFFSHLSGLGRSGVTRVRKLAAIREYLKYLVDVQKLLPSSPAEKIVRPKKERKQRVFLRVDEYMRLLGAAAGNSRDYAILQLFLQTGIRVSELIGLHLSDIDLKESAMLINGKGNKQRTVYLEKKASLALKSYLKDRPATTDDADRLMKQVPLPYRVGNPPKALRKAKLENIALVLASLLYQKGKYQNIANNLPGQGVLICQKKERLTNILERVAVFFRQRGRFVRVLPYSLI